MKISGSRILSDIRSDIKNRSENARERIKATTFELLAARGYSNVSLRDIASGAGVALSQIAYYYHSKELLICEVVGDALERGAQDFAEAMDKAEGDPVCAASAYFEKVPEENDAIWRVLLDFVSQSIWVPAFRERVSGFFDRISGILEERIASGGNDPSGGHGETAKDIVSWLFGSSVMRLLAAQS
ncbi:MAG: TetR/AcrR family transcriptional regulator [Clostridiales bacterium]|nr:TetR/AcrR family transcriptional regulator [Clostridiales bacterium]MDD7593951.1 TetR/AcrR family transcriptional regulator [Clostridiales bacterium]